MDKQLFSLSIKIIFLAIAICIWVVISHAGVGSAEINPFDTISQEIQKVLTVEEKDWLSKPRTIRIAGPKAFPPFHYYTEDGSLKGMASDYIHLIFKYLKIQPEIRSSAQWPVVLKEAKERKIDLISCAAKTIDREGYLGFTEPFLSFPLVIITRTDAAFIGGLDDLHGKTVAFIKGAASYDWIQRDKIKVNPYFVTTPLDGLKAISLGQAEAHIENLATATYLIRKYGLANLKIAAPVSHENYNLYIAVRKDWPELVSIVSKTLAIIPPQEHLAIRNRWLSVTYEYGIRKADVIQWVLGASGLAISVFLFILMWNRRLSREIKERKHTEAKLKKSEERYREYFEENVSGSYISSPDGQLIACNKEYEKIFGFTSTQQALETSIDDLFVNPDQRIEFLALIKKEKRVTGYQTVLKKVDGTPIHLIENSSGVFKENGELSRVRGFLLDVTEQKKLEAQLQKTQKIEAIGTLAGGIAHDFNNILFPVLGHTEILLEDTPEDSPIHERLKKIYKGGTRAKDLVKQILTFSRQDKFELKVMKIQPIVKEALKFIRSTIPTTIEIIQEVGMNCGSVRVDATQIYQIVMNLTTNAYHAMDETGGKLKVILKEVDGCNKIDPDMDPGTYVCLTVADTGLGMDKEVLGKIFDPFFTTKEKGRGTGMGLSVVHGIVKGMEGFIQVDSKPGMGSQFHVYLPVVEEIVERMIEHQESLTREPIQRGTENILLVDDEVDIVRIEKQGLERLGYQVFSYTDSIQALEIFRGHPDKFDMVISDVAMPNIPGDRLAAELIKIRPDIPILLCTGFSETMTEEKAVSLGIKGLMLKPISMKVLSEKIRETLDGVKSLV